MSVGQWYFTGYIVAFIVALYFYRKQGWLVQEHDGRRHVDLLGFAIIVGFSFLSWLFIVMMIYVKIDATRNSGRRIATD